jgi:hypothetical protein
MSRAIGWWLALVLVSTGCKNPYHGRPVDGAPRLPPARAEAVKLLAEVPPGRVFRALAWVAVCETDTPDDIAKVLREEAAAYGATVVANVRLEVGISNLACKRAVVANDEPSVALSGVAGILE